MDSPNIFKQNFVNRPMLCIVSASNREENLTAIFSKYCEQVVQEMGEEVQYLALDHLPSKIDLNSIYSGDNSPFYQLGEEKVAKCDKFLFVIPEYNGSYPGVLKLLIDGIAPKLFSGKKAALIGISAGHAGNLRGMDHFADVLNYINVNVMPKKLAIPRIDGLLENAELIDSLCKKQMDQQIKNFLQF